MPDEIVGSSYTSACGLLPLRQDKGICKLPFERRQGLLHADDVSLREIAVKNGTPCYVYALRDIEQRYEEVDTSLAATPHKIRYAVKANSNLAILRRMVALGSGFDIVSGGELERVMFAGGDPKSVVFSGVGKSLQEISFAIKAGIGCFNVESESEVVRIAESAKALGRKVDVSIRINPNVAVETHPYITTGLHENKFGIPEEKALNLAVHIHRNMPTLNFQGLACHIGSQLHDVEPYLSVLDSLLSCKSRLADQDVPCSTVDIGGGFGIQYEDESPFSFSELAGCIKDRSLDETELEIEPGRYLVADAGVLLTRVEYLKPAHEEGFRNFCVIDAAMNDLIRPSLYQAYHEVEPVEVIEGEEREWDIVGPVCESGDFLARGRRLAAHEGQLLAIRSVGAYGFTMSSNYNTRYRAAEIIVERDMVTVARQRESIQDLIRLELR